MPEEAAKPATRRGRPPGIVETKPRRKYTHKIRRDQIAKAKASGAELPLDYMLRVMRDPKQKAARRDHMAVRAAPYCHATYASVKVQQHSVPLAQLMAGMKPDELAAVEQLFRNVAARLQPIDHPPRLGGGEGAPGG